MKLSQSVNYAVAILLQLNAAKSTRPMTAAIISKGCRIPERFVYHILRKLVDAGMMKGTSGPRGGYQLCIPTDEITLLQVVEAVDGNLSASHLKPVHNGHQRAVDLLNQICEENKNHFRQGMQHISIAMLADL